MSTTTTTSAAKERAEKIDRYVERSAIELVWGGGMSAATQELIRANDFEELRVLLSSPLYFELWPGNDPGPGDPLYDEFQLADARSALFAAQLFDRLANVGHLQARSYRDLAQAGLATIGREAGS